MARKHTHKYYFGLLIGGDKVWACALPGCTHYMPKHMERAVENKFSLCWKCSEEFILYPHSMKRDKPLCDECAIIQTPATEAKIELEENTRVETKLLCKRCNINPRAGTLEICAQCFLVT